MHKSRDKLGNAVLNDMSQIKLVLNEFVLGWRWSRVRYFAATAKNLTSVLAFSRTSRQQPGLLGPPFVHHRGGAGLGLLTLHSCASFCSSSRQHTEDVPCSHAEYEWVDGAEPLAKYKPGGYHPVMIEDILDGRYRVVEKLGYGGYSTDWLAHHVCMKRYIAIKVCIANSQPREISVLRALAMHPPSSSSSSSSSRHLGQNLVPVPLDEFELHGPNGRHSCYTTTPAMCNLREVSFSRLFPIKVARALAYKLALAVSYVHSRGYVHGDIHLRNVLVKPPATFDELSVEQLREEYGDPETVPVMRRDGKRLPPGVPSKAVVPLCMGKDAKEFVPSDARVLLSDFGESFAPDLDPRLGEDCKTPVAMRPPEAFFEPGLHLSYSADIWSLATAIWEIIGMKALFSSEFVGIDEVASQQIDVLGPIPSSWFERWEARNLFFDEHGRPKKARHVWPRLNDAFEECVQKYRRKLDAGEFSREETAALLDLMRRMLSFRPEERPTTEEVLKSEWMVKWALPDFEASL